MQQMHEDMKRMSIQRLYETINRAKRDNTLGGDIVAKWAQYYINEKYKGRYS